ncbi:MAG TPA: efflux RND transporter periplasmic adaptor subunit [Gemmatimonadales bacterium]
MTRLLLVAVLLAGCGGRDQSRETATAQADTSPKEGATPVTTAPVRIATLAITVTAPGHTDVLRPLHVRAPFSGTVAALNVADGDRVSRGEALGTFVSRSSAAALAGARAMLAAAQTEAERWDAQRAFDLATRSLVEFPLRASEAGVVVSHAANAGDLVTEGDDILVIAPAGAVAFIAEVVQTDLPRVRPGQRVAVDLAARVAPLAGRVHGVLPAASAENLSAPVRIDLVAGGGAIGTGLFGTARITVGERRQVPVVPEAALLQDDVYGTTQVAVVGPPPDRLAHWVQVTLGARGGGQVEILSPSLPPGTAVIVSGQVGLPEGAPVRVQP